MIITAHVFSIHTWSNIWNSLHAGMAYAIESLDDVMSGSKLASFGYWVQWIQTKHRVVIADRNQQEDVTQQRCYTASNVLAVRRDVNLTTINIDTTHVSPIRIRRIIWNTHQAGMTNLLGTLDHVRSGSMTLGYGVHVDQGGYTLPAQVYPFLTHT